MKNWENNIRKVVPYVPGEQPKKEHMIKLNTNENPYPPAPGVAKAVADVDIDRLRLYPDPVVADLVQGIADFYKVENNQVFVGVGSDDVLAMIFMTFFNAKEPILFPDITYSFYDVWAEMLRIPYERIPLDDEFKIRTEDYKKAVSTLLNQVQAEFVLNMDNYSILMKAKLSDKKAMEELHKKIVSAEEALLLCQQDLNSTIWSVNNNG